MKRHASTADVQALNNRPDALFCATPPLCEFNDEDGYARREFNSLPLEEQDEVMKDIYGIEGTVEEETPTFIQECLDRLEKELEVHMEKKKGVQLARDKHPSFFENEKFRLQFLRIENYNPKLAARRLTRHCEKKLELFGLEKLGKKIQLEDLDENDMEFMLSGGLQLMSAKDRGGRFVIFSRHRNWCYKHVVNVLKSIWYMLMVAAEEKDERCDLVGISYQNGPFAPGMFDRSILKTSADIIKFLPVKLVGYHFCFDDIRFRMVWGLITVFLGKNGRLRSRDHEGTNIECRYGLMAYGIPVDAMPISIDGVEDNSNLLKWIEERRSIEDSEERPA